MKKVLVVEDNEKNMYLMEFILIRQGHQVIKAETGELGVDLAKKERPDLIIMDVQLPGIDGLETTRRIRASGVNAGVKIVAVTSYAMTGDREKVMAAGCDGYLEKPIDPDTFIEAVNNYLK